MNEFRIYKVIVCFLLCYVFSSCSSGYDVEFIEDEDNGNISTVKYENVIIISDEDSANLSYTENGDEVIIGQMDCDIKCGDYIMINPNANFEEGVLIKIDDYKKNGDKIVIKKGDVNLTEIFKDFSYNGPIEIESTGTRSSQYTDSLSYNGLDIRYFIDAGINILDSHILINGDGASASFNVRVYGECKVNVTGTLKKASVVVPIFSLPKFNVKIPYAKNKYISLPLSIKVPYSLELSCENVPINGNLIEKKIDRQFQIGDEYSFSNSKSLTLENDNWGTKLEIGSPDVIQMGLCMGVEISTFGLKIAKVDLEHGVNASLDLNSKPYGVFPKYKQFNFIRLFGYYRSLWHLSNAIKKNEFDEILWKYDLDSLDLYPRYAMNEYALLSGTNHTVVYFNDMFILNGPIEYGYVIHKEDSLPAYPSPSYLPIGLINNPEELKNNKVRSFMYDFEHSNFEPGDYYIEPYVKSGFGVTSMPLIKCMVKPSITIPDDDDEWIVD